MCKSLAYYKNLVKKFLKRFSSKLKSKEHSIWKEKSEKTSQDVKKFMTKKSNFSYRVNMMTRGKSKSSSKVGDTFDASSRFEKDKNVHNVHVYCS